MTHVFSSDLQRAQNTAQAVVDAQPSAVRLPVVPLPDLRERNFGSSEGKPFSTKAKTGPALSVHEDAETHEQMRMRIDRFIDIHLAPALESPEVHATAGELSVVIVAHGVILRVLRGALLSRYAPWDLESYAGGTGRSDNLGWSNTGYMDALVHPRSDDQGGSPSAGTTPLKFERTNLTFAVVALNETRHLQGLKKTRGGIGSSQFDQKQKTVDSFFQPAAKKEKISETDLP